MEIQQSNLVGFLSDETIGGSEIEDSLDSLAAQLIRQAQSGTFDLEPFSALPA
jgi:hypothetical protein